MICQTHRIVTNEDSCPICVALPAEDPQLAAQGMTRGDEDSYNRYCEESERDEEDRQASGGLLECPECHQRSVVAGSSYTRQYGGGYDTSYECANPECEYAEVCV